MNLFSTNKTIKTVFWSGVERFSVQGVQFFLNIILARLVTPADFGLIAMLNVFIVIAQSFVDSGFSNAIIQKKNRTESDYTTVFIFNIFISTIIYILLYSAAPFIASFYHEEKLCLICRIVGISLIIQGLSVVQIAKVSIDLNFKTLAKVSLTSILISGAIGIVCAFYGLGVWALVAQTISNSLLNTILLFILVHWTPKGRFSFASLTTMFTFGSKLLVSGLLHTIYTNLYSLVIGRKFSPSDVGYYNQSNIIARFPSVSLMAVITRALYPLQCKNQDNDDLLTSSFYIYLRFSCFVVFPIMMFITVSAKALVLTVLTDNWLPAVPIIQLLCIGYMLNGIIAQNNQILNVKGRSDLYLKAEIIKKIIGIIILVVSLPFGLICICSGIIIYNIMDMIIIIAFSGTILNIGGLRQFKQILPIFLCSLIASFVTYLSMLFFDIYILQIFIGAIIFISSYIFFCKIFKIEEFKYITKFVKQNL